jgi:hypothetical protein
MLARPYAAVADIAASWQTYLRLAADFGDDLPEGLILHAAGPTDAGTRIIDVWASEAAYREWQELFHAVVARHVDPRVAPPFVRDLELAHLVHSAVEPAGATLTPAHTRIWRPA